MAASTRDALATLLAPHGLNLRGHWVPTGADHIPALPNGQAAAVLIERGEWKDKPISLYGRNSASGTYGYFKEEALCKGDFKPNVNEQPGSASVVQSISSSAVDPMRHCTPCSSPRPSVLGAMPAARA